MEKMCSETEVKPVYLPTYSSDLIPIEVLFAKLKTFIRRNWQYYEENSEQVFDHFLEW